VAQGFFELERRLEAGQSSPVAVKGQVTGPVTFATAVKDGEGRALFYDDQARDMAVKLLALKASWQVRRLSRFGVPVVVFLDEPALGGYGSSEMISIGREDIAASLREVVAAVQGAGGLAGIHVCANTDWSLVMDTAVDVVNFDAYGYFERFLLFPDAIRAHLAAGRTVAWGLVPTSEAIDRETTESLLQRFRTHMAAVEHLGVGRETLLHQSLISPSCGTGSLDPHRARRVLRLTRSLADAVRTERGMA
jgi:methionine synthase II (cobalamin-independent)